MYSFQNSNQFLTITFLTVAFLIRPVCCLPQHYPLSAPCTHPTVLSVVIVVIPVLSNQSKLHFRVFSSIPSKTKGTATKKSSGEESAKNVEDIPKKVAPVDEVNDEGKEKMT